MAEKPHNSDWREALKFINRCPVCAASYLPEAAKVFAEEASAHLVHLTCPKCKSYFIAMLVTVGPGVSSVGMVTDLSFDDVRRLYGTEPITTDEMINGCEQIQKSIFLHSLILKG